MQNRMRTLESLGLKPDDNLSLSMVLLPIFKTKLPCELKEKWELELTKYESEEEEKEMFEGFVLGKEAPGDVNNGLPKHSRRNVRGKRFKNLDDEEKTLVQSLVGASDYKRWSMVFVLRVMRCQGAQWLSLRHLMRDGIC